MSSRLRLTTFWRRFYLVIAVGVFSLSHGLGNVLPSLPKITWSEPGGPITSWLLIGPFNADNNRSAAEIDFFAPLGASENEIDLTTVEAWLSPDRDAAKKIQSLLTRVDQVEYIDFNKLYGRVTQIGGPQAAVYALCTVQSPYPQTLWLMMASVDGCKLWLNGEPVYTAYGRRQLKRYDDSVPLQLKSGVNLLMIKITMIDPAWAMVARLEPNERAVIQTAMVESERTLKQQMISPGEPLRLGIRGLPQNALLDGQICDAKGNLIRTVKLGLGRDGDISDLPHGSYGLSLTAETGQTRSTNFVIGSLDTLQPELAVRSRSQSQEDRIAINLETLLRRLEILRRPYSPPSNRDPRAEYYFNTRKEISTEYTIRSLSEALARLDSHEEAFRHRPGLHLRGFRSRVDDQVFHYRLYVPANYDRDGDGLALVVVMPTVFETNRPYLESVYLADHQQAEDWSKMANDVGLGILWPGYRVAPYGNPADETYLEEVLQTVAGDYKIDPSRLYLYGTCSGGMFGAMEAARNADRYAAVAFINPVLRRLKHRYDDKGDFAGLPAYRSWLGATDPVEKLAAVSDTPIWLLHDGIDPDHGPLSQSVEFVELARALGHPAKFLRRLPEYRMQTMFAWLASHRRSDPKPLTFRSQAKAGPLSRGLAERFVVVRGTLGKDAANLASRQWCDRFIAAWKHLNNVPCREVNDVDLTLDEEQQSNLVLIGNPDTNAVWRRLAPQLQVDLQPTEIISDYHTWSGPALAIAAWQPHPAWKERRVILIGAADLVQADIGTMELALDGWFDYAIWKTESGQTRLIAAGAWAPYK